MPKSVISDFRTERLAVSHWASQLTSPARKSQLSRDLLPILSPKVLAHLPPLLQVPQSQRAIDTWITERAAESDVYRITSLHDGSLVGLLILVDVASDGAPPNVHLGYLLAEKVWGQGYASEMLRGLLEAAKNVSPLTLIGGVAHDNPASAHILRKLGFQLQTDLSDAHSEVFAISLIPPKDAPV